MTSGDDFDFAAHEREYADYYAAARQATARLDHAQQRYVTALLTGASETEIEALDIERTLADSECERIRMAYYREQASSSDSTEDL